MQIIKDIGSYAGMAAIVGLAVLAALYFSQARDVKRLREWAGRAPERAAGQAVPGQVAPQRVVAQPQQPGAPVSGAPAPGAPAKPGQPPSVPTPAPAQAAAGAAPAMAKAQAAKPAAATPAGQNKQGGAAPTGTAPSGTAPAAPAKPGEGTPSEGSKPADGKPPGATPAPTPAAAPAVPGKPADGAPAKPSEGAPTKTGAGTPAEPVRAVPAAVAPAAPAKPGEAAPTKPGEAAPTKPGEAAPTKPGEPGGAKPDEDAPAKPGEGAQGAPPPPVLSATPASERTPRLPSRQPATPRPAPSQTAILPPYGEAKQPWYRRNPRYLVLALAGILIVGGGAAFGISQLTKQEAKPLSKGRAAPATGGGGTSEPNQGKKAPAVDPSRVTVSVLNGTTVPGLAAQIGDKVEAAHFKLGNVTNSTDQQKSESVVLYAPGAKREAAAVGRKLSIAQREPIDPQSQSLGGDATVVVIAGADKTQ
jgi:LytR cell envelope-related transcriptional attenuator